MFGRILQKFENTLTLRLLGKIAFALVFYQAIWLGAALYRLLVLQETPPLELAAEGRGRGV
jgi:hypothetical protein